MKHYNEVTAKGAYPIHLANIFACFYVFFSPELWLLGLAFVIDLAMLVAVYFVDSRGFLRVFPQFKLTFQKEEIEQIGELNTNQQVGFLEGLLSYPYKRSLWVFAVSFAKVIPVGILLVHVNPNGLGPKWLQWIQFYALEFFAFSYFMGTVHIELHKFITQKIAEYHSKFNWEKSFQKINIQQNVSEFLRFESVAQGMTLFGLFLMTLLLVVVGGTKSSARMLVDMLLLQSTSLLCIMKLYTMNRSYFIESLNNMIDFFKELDPAKKIVVPVHTSSVLSRFSSVFNLLSRKLSSREKELVEWMNYEIEQSHYKSLGQISALVVHDLAGPLQALHMISEEIKAAPRDGEDQLVSNLERNSKYAIELIESLKMYLKNNGQHEEVAFAEVHQNILNILKTQFVKTEFESIKVSLDRNLIEKKILTNRQTIAHILYNVYKNSYQNLISIKADAPQVRVSLHDQGESQLCLRFEDNGSGLSSEEFEELTSMRVNFTNTPFQRSGLGLRLTRRLIESQGGSLRLIEPGSGGTTLEVILPGQAPLRRSAPLKPLQAAPTQAETLQ